MYYIDLFHYGKFCQMALGLPKDSLFHVTLQPKTLLWDWDSVSNFHVKESVLPEIGDLSWTQPTTG